MKGPEFRLSTEGHEAIAKALASARKEAADIEWVVNLLERAGDLIRSDDDLRDNLVPDAETRASFEALRGALTETVEKVRGLSEKAVLNLGLVPIANRILEAGPTAETPDHDAVLRDAVHELQREGNPAVCLAKDAGTMLAAIDSVLDSSPKKRGEDMPMRLVSILVTKILGRIGIAPTDYPNGAWAVAFRVLAAEAHGQHLAETSIRRHAREAQGPKARTTGKRPYHRPAVADALRDDLPMERRQWGCEAALEDPERYFRLVMQAMRKDLGAPLTSR